ncbi:MAG: flavin reductase family protein [Bacteroidia bacterium]|nr:flavin reductase family protein [Bacteroidia bacterium]
MLTVNPATIKTSDLHAYMLAAIAPRPIAFASTVDAAGKPNLSPFSFFNAFGSKPPVLVFSPARRVRDNTTKHTLQNVLATKEVVINVVNYAMVQQQSLASTEYEAGVNEFIKAGLTPVASELVKPFRVKESPVQMECKVLDVIETGNQGGAGNLIVCEIMLMHINETILDVNQKIDPYKIDLVARLGGDWYCRASGNALFEVAKPLTTKGMGIDQLPEQIRNSQILTGNDLGKLGNTEHIPTTDEIKMFEQENEGILLKQQLQQVAGNKDAQHRMAQSLLQNGKVKQAWFVLMMHN